MDALSKHIDGTLQEDGKGEIGNMREGNFVVEDRLLKPDDKIYDLIDVVDNVAENELKKDREIIVIDGRVYERVSDQGDSAFDGADVVERDSAETRYDSALDEEITKRVIEITERIAREIVPEIAERIIREEIEKLKQ